jgi:hypothetical protein
VRDLQFALPRLSHPVIVRALGVFPVGDDTLGGAGRAFGATCRGSILEHRRVGRVGGAPIGRTPGAESTVSFSHTVLHVC